MCLPPITADVRVQRLAIVRLPFPALVYKTIFFGPLRRSVIFFPLSGPAVPSLLGDLDQCDQSEMYALPPTIEKTHAARSSLFGPPHFPLRDTDSRQPIDTVFTSFALYQRVAKTFACYFPIS